MAHMAAAGWRAHGARKDPSRSLGTREGLASVSGSATHSLCTLGALSPLLCKGLGSMAYGFLPAFTFFDALSLIHTPQTSIMDKLSFP